MFIHILLLIIIIIHYSVETIFLINFKMKDIKITSKQEKIVPDILKVLNIPEDKYYSTKTNIRIKTHFTITSSKMDEDLKYLICYARNQIFKNQYRIPMKALFAEPGNLYICQKAPLMDKSNNIKNAAKVIEPLNIGFDEYIRCIPINQNLKVGTMFTIDVSVPYSSDKRYRFKSNQIVPVTEINMIPFDQHIDIGELDIGSRYTGKFKVDNVNLDIYDSYTMFTFDICENNIDFDIYTYEFMNVDLKYVFREIIKIIQNSDETYKPEFTKYSPDCIEFLNKCIDSLK